MALKFLWSNEYHFVPMLTGRYYSTRQESKPWKQRPNRKAKLSIILMEDLTNLGCKGQIVKVNHGYGRNYLLPKGKAVYATPGNIEMHNAWASEKGRLSLANESQFVADFLAGKVLVVEQEPKPRWVILPQHISSSFRRRFQLHIPLDCILLEKPLTAFGAYDVGLKLDDTTTVTVNVEVVQKKQKRRNKPGPEASVAT